MKSIGVRFSLAVGGLAIVFSAFILYRAWSAAKADTDRLTSLQAQLALEFDLAIREYAAEAIRPAMEKRVGKDEFVIEAMSTSFISRNVFEKVKKKFPDYVIKFSSDNPRNPANLAGPEELERLHYFRDHPEEKEWAGRLVLNGEQYYAHLHAMRMTESCLRCHGQPEDSPKALLERYRGGGGFHRNIGDVAGMDVIAIPLDKVHATLRAEAGTSLLTTAVCLLALFAAILLTFRRMVSRRLAGITGHFRQAAAESGDAATSALVVSGDDEISQLGRSFNTLATRLRESHTLLEDRVRQRTAEVRHEQDVLRHLLQSSDHERRLIAYEIHDGLAQQLAGALMHLESAARRSGQDPARAAAEQAEAVALVRQSHAEARRLINGVRPPVLDEAGIVPAIEHLLHDGGGIAAGLQAEFRHEVAFDRLAPVLENAVYRIVQEGLTNVRSHSKSPKARVELLQRNNELEVVIEDWGVGFDADQTPSGCFGLKGIQERARLLGGSARVESRPGQGTRIVVKLPVVVRQGDGAAS